MTLTTDFSSLPLRRFNAEEYQRLVEGGIFIEADQNQTLDLLQKSLRKI